LLTDEAALLSTTDDDFSAFGKLLVYELGGASVERVTNIRGEAKCSSPHSRLAFPVVHFIFMKRLSQVS
jgi:hypothetical protein